jgi:hypothetical protein
MMAMSVPASSNQNQRSPIGETSQQEAADLLNVGKRSSLALAGATSGRQRMWRRVRTVDTSNQHSSDAET